jgi:hypothetical protein
MKRTFNSHVIIAAFAVIAIIGLQAVRPMPVFADSKVSNDYTLLEPLPCIPSATFTCPSATVTKTDVTQYVNYIFRLGIALAAFLAVFMFTVGAFQYMTSEATGAKSDAKSRMTNSILGLLAALISYTVLYTIDPRLVQINANVDKLNITTTSISSIFQQSTAALLTQNQQTLAALNQLPNPANSATPSTAFTDQASTTRAQAQAVHQQAVDFSNGVGDDYDDEMSQEQKDEKLAEYQEQEYLLNQQANELQDQGTIIAGVQNMSSEVQKYLSQSPTSQAEIANVRTQISNEFDLQLHDQLADSTDATTTKAFNEVFVPEKKYEMNTLDNYSDTIGVVNSTGVLTQAALDQKKDASVTGIQTRTNALIASVPNPTLPQGQDLIERYQADAQKNIAAISNLKSTKK